MIPLILRHVLTMTAVAFLATTLMLALYAGDPTTYLVRGRSMEPTLPLGSLISVVPVRSGDIAVGNIVTVAADNGVVITHRVTRVVTDASGGHYFQLQGDANADADPSLVPGRSVLGRVGYYVPIAGLLVAMLAVPSGMLSVGALFGSLLLGIRLLRSLEGVPTPVRAR